MSTRSRSTTTCRRRLDGGPHAQAHRCRRSLIDCIESTDPTDSILVFSRTYLEPAGDAQNKAGQSRPFATASSSTATFHRTSAPR
eukprot:7389884-Prymnesium_polylepis.3